MYTGSIEANTNKVISSTCCNLAGVKSNSFLRFKGINCLFDVLETKNNLLFFDAELLNIATIIINYDTGINILNNDDIKLIYPEYQLVSVFGITQGGKNYKVGDKISLNIDCCIYDIVSGRKEDSVFEVKEVDENGAIKQIGLISKGRYYRQITAQNIDCFGGNGFGAVLHCIFSETLSQPKDRKVINISFSDGKTFIYLNEPLPNIKNCKISLSKWELLISPIINTKLENKEFEIIQDFTPNLRLPILVNNSFSRDVLINRSLTIIDSEIQALKDKLSNIL